jgi:peptidoglycan/LPS O-acetylase OafA/YrhL
MTPGLSIYLDLVRVAALLVLLFHASYDRFGGNWLRPAFADSGQPAVIMFFVLSGFVIAWTADVKERTFNVYIVNRMARLWSVAVPALALTLFADKIGLAIDPKIYPGWLLPLEAHPFRQLAISATFLNQVWFFDVQPLSNGGTMSPLAASPSLKGDGAGCSVWRPLQSWVRKFGCCSRPG